MAEVGSFSLSLSSRSLSFLLALSLSFSLPLEMRQEKEAERGQGAAERGGRWEKLSFSCPLLQKRQKEGTQEEKKTSSLSHQEEPDCRRARVQQDQDADVLGEAGADAAHGEHREAAVHEEDEVGGLLKVKSFFLFKEEKVSFTSPLFSVFLSPLGLFRKKRSKRQALFTHQRERRVERVGVDAPGGEDARHEVHGRGRGRGGVGHLFFGFFFCFPCVSLLGWRGLQEFFFLILGFGSVLP